jgi:hypothetical protein
VNDEFENWLCAGVGRMERAHETTRSLNALDCMGFPGRNGEEL